MAKNLRLDSPETRVEPSMTGVKSEQANKNDVTILNCAILRDLRLVHSSLDRLALGADTTQCSDPQSEIM